MQSNLVILAKLLSKLWKIRHHTDPSAPSKKAQLYQKYQLLCKRVALEYKEKSNWQVLITEIHKLSFPISEKENSKTLQVQLGKKLIEDLETFFVTKYVPSTLAVSLPSKTKSPKQRPKIEPREQRDPSYTVDHILKMAKTLRFRQEASYQLQEMIANYRKIDPVKIEKQIATYLAKKQI